jgi:WhiB family redox-sensing transcriptional regulator
MAMPAWELDVLMTPGGPPPSVLDLIRRPAWMREAACRGADVNVFFPSRGEPTEAARELCDRCPARAPCLSYALAEDLEGVWAATSKRQRRALRREAS